MRWGAGKRRAEELLSSAGDLERRALRYFYSGAENLVGNDDNTRVDIFLRGPLR
jgi:hypothetical protein